MKMTFIWSECSERWKRLRVIYSKQTQPLFKANAALIQSKRSQRGGHLARPGYAGVGDERPDLTTSQPETRPHPSVLKEEQEQEQEEEEEEEEEEGY